MAKRFIFTDKFGNVYPEAYCVLAPVVYDPKFSLTAYLTFVVYRDKAARAAKMAPVDAFNHTVANSPGKPGIPAVTRPIVVTPAVPAVDAVPAVMDGDTVVTPEIPATPAVPAVMGEEIVTPAVPEVPADNRFDRFFGLDVLSGGKNPIEQGWDAYAEVEPNYFTLHDAQDC